MLDEDFLRRLEGLRLAVGRYVAGRREGDRPGRATGPSLEFRSHRAYAPGDDPRLIDWNAYARLGQLVVKEFLAQRTDLVEIRVDASRSMTVGRPAKWDAACRLAAAISAVGQAAFGEIRVVAGGSCRWSSREPWGRLIDLLRAAQAWEGGPPESLLDDLPRRRDAVVVLLSDLWPRGGDGTALESALRGAAHRCSLSVLHVLAPEETDPPWEGALRLADVESGRSRMLLVGEPERSRYRVELSRHLETVRRAVVEGGGSYVLLRSDQPVEDAVFVALREAGILE